MGFTSDFRKTRVERNPLKMAVRKQKTDDLKRQEDEILQLLSRFVRAEKCLLPIIHFSRV